MDHVQTGAGVEQARHCQQAVRKIPAGILMRYVSFQNNYSKSCGPFLYCTIMLQGLFGGGNRILLCIVASIVASHTFLQKQCLPNSLPLWVVSVRFFRTINNWPLLLDGLMVRSSPSVGSSLLGFCRCACNGRTSYCSGERGITVDHFIWYSGRPITSVYSRWIPVYWSSMFVVSSLVMPWLTVGYQWKVCSAYVQYRPWQLLPSSRAFCGDAIPRQAKTTEN